MEADANPRAMGSRLERNATKDAKAEAHTNDPTMDTDSGSTDENSTDDKAAHEAGVRPVRGTL